MIVGCNELNVMNRLHKVKQIYIRNKKDEREAYHYAEECKYVEEDHHLKPLI